MINEYKSYRYFDKTNSNDINNNNIKSSLFHAPVKSNSFVQLPNVIPSIRKNNNNNLDVSKPFEESSIAPLVELRLNNIPHMNQYLDFKNKKHKRVLLKNNSTILPMILSNNIRIKKRELNLSNLNNKSKSSPHFKDFNSLKIRNNSCDLLKINTELLNANDNIQTKWTINKIGFQSKAGNTCYGESKTNQDSFLILTHNNKEKGLNNTNKDFYLFGVFDGHGENGHYASQNVKKTIENYFTNDILNFNKETNEETCFFHLINNNYQVITDAFKKASETLKKQPFNCFLSGATCILVIIVNDTIICANVGDSKTMLYSNQNQQCSLELFTDKKPQLKEELGRIIMNNGDVSKMKHTDQGFYRVWMKNESFPGLAMNRSIGDFLAQKVDVISIPEIKVKQISAHDYDYIVIGSDGLWKWLTLEEVNRIVFPYFKGNNVFKAANQLVDSARRKWSKMSNTIDDITVIVIFFGKKVINDLNYKV